MSAAGVPGSTLEFGVAPGDGVVIAHGVAFVRIGVEFGENFGSGWGEAAVAVPFIGAAPFWREHAG